MNEMLEVSGLKPLIENDRNSLAPASRHLVLVSPFIVEVAPPLPGVGPVVMVCVYVAV